MVKGHFDQSQIALVNVSLHMRGIIFLRMAIINIKNVLINDFENKLPIPVKLFSAG